MFTRSTVSNKNKCTHITHTAYKIIGLPTPSLSNTNDRAITCIAQIIAHDPEHTPNPFFTLLP